MEAKHIDATSLESRIPLESLRESEYYRRDAACGICYWYMLLVLVLVLVLYNDFFILRRAVSYPTHTSTYTHIHIFFLLDRGSSKRQLLFKPGTSTALCVRGNCTLSGKYNYYIIPLDGNELLEIHTKSLFVNKFSYMFLMIEILKYGKNFCL